MNKKNSKIFALATVMLLLVNGAYLNAQVTVGANSVPNATLDIVATAADATLAGVIAPRVGRQYLNDKNDNYGLNQTGAIVYVNEVLNGAASGQAVNVTTAGYYYFDGTLWQPFISSNEVTTNVMVEHLAGNSFSASLFSAQRTVIVHYGASTLTLTLPDLTSADKGKIVVISNRGTVGTIQTNLTMIEQSSGTPQLTALPAPIALNRSRSIMWIGNAWIELAL